MKKFLSQHFGIRPVWPYVQIKSSPIFTNVVQIVDTTDPIILWINLFANAPIKIRIQSAIFQKTAKIVFKYLCYICNNICSQDLSKWSNLVTLTICHSVTRWLASVKMVLGRWWLGLVSVAIGGRFLDIVLPLGSEPKLVSDRVVGSGCGSVGRAFASDTTDLQFESNNGQI